MRFQRVLDAVRLQQRRRGTLSPRWADLAAEYDYADQAHSDARALADLLREFAQVRRSNLSFFRSLHDDAWLRRGVANGDPVTVRALAYLIAGHERHHVGILRKRLTES